MINNAIRKQRSQFIWATLLSIASACLSIYVLSSVNTLATTGIEAVERSGGIALGILALFVTSFAAQSALSYTGTRIVADIRTSLSEQFLKQPLEKLMAMEKGHVSGSLISDVTRIAAMLMMAPLMIFNVLVLLFCLAYLSTISLDLFWVLCGFLALAIVTTAVLLAKAQKHFISMREAEDTLFEGFRAIEEAKRELSNDDRRIDFFLKSEIKPGVELARSKDFKAQLWWNFSGSWSSAMIFIALLCVMYFGASWLKLSSEVLLQFVIVTLYMTGPIAFIVNSNQAIARGLVSLKKLSMLKLSEPRELCYQQSPFKDWQHINLQNLQYQYKSKDSEFEFGPVSFSINRGESYFVIGGNGSGKSTLAQLLTGLVHPDHGTIDVDGQQLDSDNYHQYRNLSSSIFFDVYLFRFFLNNNAELANDSDILKLAKMFHMEHKVKIENGRIKDIRFSQGQKKRIALIQSLLQDKDILLFDEVAADQDPMFKEFFYYTLLPQLKQQGKTLLVISHDDRYFDCADHLLKLEDGQLINQQDKEQCFEQVV